MERRALSRSLGALRTVVRAIAGLLARTVATLAAASLFVFLLLEISLPGGFRAVVLPNGDSASPRARALIEKYHLDDHILIRYGHWMSDALRGNFGRSFRNDQPITDMILDRISISLELMLVGVFLTLLLGIPLGLLAVARGGRLLNGFFGLSQSIPIYVTPMFLIAFFAVYQRWLPASGWTRISESLTGNLKGLILPMTALVLSEVGAIARIVRADVLRVMETDFIAAARGKGLSSRYILFRHAFRPASLGLLNVISLNIGSLLTGALVLELIFGIGGLGQLLLESVLQRDLYMLLGITTYAVVVYAVLNTLVDGLMLWADPRIRR
jgi:peptide/nickel transport system permease protein